jgi:uncharacterized membrane protein YqaE (UPF0057 family)
MSARMMGIAIGFGFGVVWIALGFGAAVLAVVLALLGWFIGAVIEGKIDLSAVWYDLQGRRREMF